MTNVNTKPKKQIKPIKALIKKDLNAVVDYANNAPVKIYDHITGSRFTHKHKMVVGASVMCIGVGISIFFPMLVSHHHFIVFMADGIGYLLHGAGCIPFLEYLHSKVDESIKNKGSE